MTAALSYFFGAADVAVLGDVDVALARVLARRFPDATPDALLAASLASWAVQQGHACLDLDALRSHPSLRALIERDPRIGTLDLDAMQRDAGALAGVLRVEGPRIHLERYATYEAQLADAFALRLAGNGGSIGAQAAARLDAWFAGTAPDDPQRRAVERALTESLVVLSGGPGTGKTWTVARAVAALAEEPSVRRIALAAPTGKAAARLYHGLSAAVSALAPSDDARAKLPREATTLHRLIGLHPDRVAPRHGPDNPLALDVLVIDEASMIDLALFAKTMRAVPVSCRVILVGDPGQLPAVEAGAPFAELVRFGRESTGMTAPVVTQGELFGDVPIAADARSRRSRARAGAVAESAAVRSDGSAATRQPSTGSTEHAPSRPTSPTAPQTTAGRASATSAHGSFVHLDRARRFAADSPIAAVLDAIRAGDADDTIAALRAAGDAIVWHEGAIGASRAAFDALVRARYAALAAGDARAALDTLDRFRVLCALREGAAGVAGLNLAIEQTLGGRRRADAGRPLLVTGNDIDLGLYNGDAGVLVLGGHSPVAHFASGTSVRRVALAQLPPHETGYAMTVHKAQGSEFDELAIVLPGEPHPLVTREWLYTAISRAKSRVHLFGPAATIGAAVEAVTVRMSGLVDRLGRDRSL